MPRLIVPSIGGGTKLMRTVLAGEATGVCSGASGGEGDPSGEINGAGDSAGITEEVGVGDSCAAAIATKIHAAAIRNPQSAIRNSNIVPPIHVREQVVAPFTVVQKFFVDTVCDKLIV